MDYMYIALLNQCIELCNQYIGCERQLFSVSNWEFRLVEFYILLCELNTGIYFAA